MTIVSTPAFLPILSQLFNVDVSGGSGGAGGEPGSGGSGAPGGLKGRIVNCCSYNGRTDGRRGSNRATGSGGATGPTGASGSFFVSALDEAQFDVLFPR